MCVFNMWTLAKKHQGFSSDRVEASVWVIHSYACQKSGALPSDANKAKKQNHCTFQVVFAIYGFLA